jgi:hypothetical protein
MLGLKYPPVVLLNKYKHKDDFVIHATDSEKEKKYKKMFGEMAADLFQDIGKGVNMKYGCDTSLASIRNAINFLTAKFFFASDMGPYYILGPKFSVIIEAGLIVGSIFMAYDCDSNKGCHFWIIDGMAQKNGSLHIHNNWGWDGDANGYYLSSVFNPRDLNYQNLMLVLVRWP